MSGDPRLTDWQIVCEINEVHPDWTVADHVAYLKTNGPDTDRGPSLLRRAVVRLLALAVAIGAVRLGLREWPTATVALVILGAAWMLGRVD
jgi:hypothetical protein